MGYRTSRSKLLSSDQHTVWRYRTSRSKVLGSTGLRYGGTSTSFAMPAALLHVQGPHCPLIRSLSTGSVLSTGHSVARA
eukprot:2914678-Rhodomonas_salina.3